MVADPVAILDDQVGCPEADELGQPISPGRRPQGPGHRRRQLRPRHCGRCPAIRSGACRRRRSRARPMLLWSPARRQRPRRSRRASRASALDQPDGASLALFVSVPARRSRARRCSVGRRAARPGPRRRRRARPARTPETSNRSTGPDTGRRSAMPIASAAAKSTSQFMPCVECGHLAILVSFARGIDQRCVDVRSDGRDRARSAGRSRPRRSVRRHRQSPSRRRAAGAPRAWPRVPPFRWRRRSAATRGGSLSATASSGRAAAFSGGVARATQAARAGSNRSASDRQARPRRSGVAPAAPVGEPELPVRPRLRRASGGDRGRRRAPGRGRCARAARSCHRRRPRSGSRPVPGNSRSGWLPASSVADDAGLSRRRPRSAGRDRPASVMASGFRQQHGHGDRDPRRELAQPLAPAPRTSDRARARG